MVDQHLDKVAVPYYTTPSFIKKVELMQDLIVEAVKVLINSQVNFVVEALSSLKLQVWSLSLQFH